MIKIEETMGLGESLSKSNLNQQLLTSLELQTHLKYVSEKFTCTTTHTILHLFLLVLQPL